MDPQRWSRIESLYHSALAKAPHERGHYLAVECAHEPDLRREVESLLKGADEPLKRIGPYEIVGLLGAGGMGEVYRAKDTRLKREVALKLLPECFADDPARMARFQREAELLASINHPNIAHVYGLEDRAIVMELVEGEALPCPLPIDTALKCARQIAEALEYAHEKGIIHRDLKPANIKVTPEGVVKLLDFGLAKALTGPESSANPSDSPTLTIGGTAAGVILGTAAYMSPEQARGKPTDRRADIWSFGAVLYEMLTGRQLYTGETTSDILAAVIADEPVLDGLPPDLHPIIEKCLRKDLRRRWQSIGDVRLALEERSPAPSHPRRSPLQTGLLVWAAGVTLALAALAFVYFRDKSPDPEVVRFQFTPPGRNPVNSVMFIREGAFALSPDGRYAAFIAPGSGGASQLWVRSLDALESRPVAQTDRSSHLIFWSPDSRYIGFAAASKLQKVAVSGGSPQSLCDIQSSFLGAAWNREGVIVFATFGSGIRRVPDTGGEVLPVINADRSHGEQVHNSPAFLPDQRHFLYGRLTGRPSDSGIFIGSLDNPPDQQSSTRLVSGDSGVYVPRMGSDYGYLLFTREGSLMAQSFNAGNFALRDEAVPLADGLAPGGFSASPGVLAYTADTALQLAWFDRLGKISGLVSEPGNYGTLALSPDGTRAVTSRIQRGNSDLWVHEFARGTGTRLTSRPEMDWLGVWSPDGNRIIFSSLRDGSMNLYQKSANGAGNEESVFRSDEPKLAQDWSHNGRFLLYCTRNSTQGGGSLDLFVLPLEGERKPLPYLTNESYASMARFAPDDGFVAYTSNASGRNEVYVRPFPASSQGRWLVSKGGGSQPRWRRDGRELFYISPDSKMMSVDITTAPVFQPGVPKALFTAPISGGGPVSVVTRYDVTADGKNFLINAVPSEANGGQGAPITVILNWQRLLKAK